MLQELRTTIDPIKTASAVSKAISWNNLQRHLKIKTLMPFCNLKDLLSYCSHSACDCFWLSNVCFVLSVCLSFLLTSLWSLTTVNRVLLWKSSQPTLQSDREQNPQSSFYASMRPRQSEFSQIWWMSSRVSLQLDRETLSRETKERGNFGRYPPDLTNSICWGLVLTSDKQLKMFVPKTEEIF